MFTEHFTTQALDLETMFKHFDLNGWLKVSYLLDYMVSNKRLDIKLANMQLLQSR